MFINIFAARTLLYSVKSVTKDKVNEDKHRLSSKG